MTCPANDKIALILAAHGSTLEPDVNAGIQTLTDQVRAKSEFDEVIAAFHQGEPRFCEVLDRVNADRVFVVPLMTSEGYYATEKLPAALAQNARFEKVKLIQTRPVGTHPALAATLAQRAQRLALNHEVDTAELTIALVGHGTPRNAASRYATETAAVSVSELLPHAQLLTAYLDDQPPIETIMQRAIYQSVIVIPFLIGGGAHTVRDLPVRLGLLNEISENTSVIGSVDGKQVMIDVPVGQYAEIIDWVIQLAAQAAEAT